MDDESLLIESLIIAAANSTLFTAASTTSFTGSGILLPFAGSALVGYIIGFALKKILKWLLIGLGVLAGIIFIVIQWMSQNGYVQGVKWDKLGNGIAQYGQHLATQLDFNNLSGVFHYLG